MTGLKNFRDALDRVATDQPLPHDLERLSSGIQKPQLLAIAVALYPELRPGNHKDPDDFTHTKPGITALRKLLWTPEFIAQHPTAIVVQSNRGRWPGTFQYLWSHICGHLSINTPASESAFLRSSLAWGQLDVLGNMRTGVTSSPAGFESKIPQSAPRFCAKLFRDSSMLSVKRIIAVLHERKAAEGDSAVIAKLTQVTVELEKGVDVFHRELFGKPLPRYKSTSSPLSVSNAVKKPATKVVTVTASNDDVQYMNRAVLTAEPRRGRRLPWDTPSVEAASVPEAAPPAPTQTAGPISRPSMADSASDTGEDGVEEDSGEGAAEEGVGAAGGDSLSELEPDRGTNLKRKALVQTILPQYFKKLKP